LQAVAAVVLREKTTDEQGNLREMVIWQVEPNPRQPEGIRYRLALILPKGIIATSKASRNPMGS
jgi:hypothetical protein